MRNVPTTVTDAAIQRSIRTNRSSAAVTAATLARRRVERRPTALGDWTAASALAVLLQPRVVPRADA